LAITFPGRKKCFQKKKRKKCKKAKEKGEERKKERKKGESREYSARPVNQWPR